MPTSLDQKFCQQVGLAPLAGINWSGPWFTLGAAYGYWIFPLYVPSPQDRAGDFSWMSPVQIINPVDGLPFPNNIIAPFLMPDVVGVRISPGPPGRGDAFVAALTGLLLPAVRVTPNVFHDGFPDFGSLGVGFTSSPQTLTVTNVGDADMTITSITTTTGDFAQTNTCGSSLAPNATCTVSVTFTPTAEGALTGEISFTTNLWTSPNTEALSGTGVAAPAVNLSPDSLDFEALNSQKTVTLSNPGTAELNIASISITPGDFALDHNCPASVASGASCTLTVTFTPPATGTSTGLITITDNAPGSPHTVTLSCAGNTPVGDKRDPVWPVDSSTGTTPVTLRFDNVTQAGNTTLTTSSAGEPPPSGFNLGSPPTYYYLTTTAVYAGSIEVCINYSGVSYSNPEELSISHYAGTWIPLPTTSLDTATTTICASTPSLSPFAIFEPAYVGLVQPPIKADGSSVFKASRGVVPVKFTLTVNGARTCQLPPATISLSRTAGTVLGSIAESVYLMPSDNGSNFRTTDCQYIYNLGTGSLGTGTYRVNIVIGGVIVGSGVFGLD
jgi:hypothetical protein